ncbi:hypothetical protein EVAR_16563_1 [Eumeta japonica]|uniref:Uncharacterized protein n=1 Tax=Eumeta variegata TaxID=151549 RepID=A0A4C1U349_EUMVA|nr:hypothetical protein EVAR_16563_1 [Eumeta japonica]
MSNLCAVQLIFGLPLKEVTKGFTVHWIESKTFERKSAAIACRRFKGAHTYDKVDEMIADVHSNYNLKLSKMVKTVTDNGSNMVKAFDVFGKSDSEVVENERVSHAFGDLEKSSLDEGSEDDDSLLVLQAFPDALLDLEGDCLLPGHERCATHTLHLIASTDFKQARTKIYFIRNYMIQPYQSAKHCGTCVLDLQRHARHIYK